MEVQLKSGEKRAHCIDCECETPHILADGREFCTGKRAGHPNGPCAKFERKSSKPPAAGTVFDSARRSLALQSSRLAQDTGTRTSRPDCHAGEEVG